MVSAVDRPAAFAARLRRDGVLFLMPRNLYQGWPFSNDFTRHILAAPSSCFPQLAAMIPELPVRYLDAGLDRRLDYTDYLAQLGSAPVVCLSAVSPLVALNTELTVRLIRKHFPNTLIVLGGHHATFYADQWLARGVHVVVRREGEPPFQNLLRALRDGRPLDDIPGLSYRDRDGRARHNPEAPFLPDLDALPLPNWDIVDLAQYRFRLQPLGHPATIESARGCPHGCAFCCAASMWNHTQRFKSAERIIGEMENLVGRGVGQILFADDNFAARRDRDLRVFDEILKRGWRLGLWCFLRADLALSDPEYLDVATRAGLRMVYIGYETVCDETLDKYEKNPAKGVGPAAYPQIYRLLKSRGVFVYGLFVRDFDAEQEDKVRWPVWRQVRRISDITAQTRFIPMRGVPGSEDLAARGYELKDLFYHDRFMPAFRYRGRPQGSRYVLTAAYDLLKPANFYKMLAGSFVERSFFRSLYRGLLADLFRLRWLNLRAFAVTMRPNLPLDERQRRISTMFRRAFGVAETPPGGED